MKGKVLLSGGSWQRTGADDIGRVDYRATRGTDDGAQNYLELQGIARDDPTRPERPEGKPAEYGDRNFSTTPRFQTDDDRFAWRNGSARVGEGKPAQGRVSNRLYAGVND